MNLKVFVLSKFALAEGVIGLSARLIPADIPNQRFTLSRCWPNSKYVRWFGVGYQPNRLW